MLECSLDKEKDGSKLPVCSHGWYLGSLRRKAGSIQDQDVGILGPTALPALLLLHAIEMTLPENFGDLYTCETS